MSKGLCFRCEKRAYALETGFGPRAECKEPSANKYSCYCYEPVKPVIMVRDKEDDRPQFAHWTVSARSHRSDIEPELWMMAKEMADGFVVYWSIKPPPG